MVYKSKHGKQERIAVTIQLVVGNEDDDALIAAIANIADRKRNATLKNWLRDSQGFKSSTHKTEGPDHSQALSYLVDKMQWMENAMTDLKPYLDNMFASTAMRSPSPFATPPHAPAPDKESASQETLDRRKQRLKERKW